jgi:glutamate carboxypeptidase
LKTARKGVGQFELLVSGKAAHAGLEPEKGISAIQAMSIIVQELFALNDPLTGISVNVGVIEGGLRTNVVAPTCRALIDVRAPTAAAASQLERSIRELKPPMLGVSLQLTGGFNRPPLERTPRNRALWRNAVELGKQLDLQLQEGSAGGGSDGNFTSLHTATLDGLGAVGDGAHAPHEFIYISGLIERTALLALLLLSP